MRTLTRRRLLAVLMAASGAASATVLSACLNRQPQPAPRGVPTLMPTALPTAVPASAGRVTPAPTSSADQRSTPLTRATTTPTLASGAAKRDVVILQGADITSLDPHRSTFTTDINVTFALFDALTFRGVEHSVIQPMLATEWRVEDRRWTLRLRPNVRFHNGDPLTSADVKFSIERTSDPAARTAVANVFSTVERIDTPDPLTVVVGTQHPDALLPARLASFGGQIVPKRYLEQVGAAGFERRPVGAGPYRFVEWQKDGHVVLERFDGYWGGPPAFERVVFRPRPNAATRVTALLSGDADLVPSVLADQIDTISRSGRARIDGALYNGLHVLSVNSMVPPLDNPLVKQALSLAIDRETIIRTVHRGQGVVPNGLIAQGDFGHDATLPPLEYNPTRARERLQQAGYRDEPIVIEATRGYLDGDREMSEMVHEMWRKVGVNSKLQHLEMAERAEKTRQKSFLGVYWSDPASTLMDPDGMMYRLLGPGGAQATWTDPEWQRLGAEARSSLDQAVRLQNYRLMNALALEHLPWIPVLQPRRLCAIANTIEFQPYTNGYVDVRRENLRPRS